MASELIELQGMALALQDKERELDEQVNILEEELSREQRLNENADVGSSIKSQGIRYLSALCNVVQSRRIASSVTPIVGEMRVQLSQREAIVLEVSPNTEFGDIIETILDYIGYPKIDSADNQQQLHQQPRVPSTSALTIEHISNREDSLVSVTRTIRPRSEFCLCDEFGAIFCSEAKVAETFASSAVLWMASLTVKPNAKGEVFDPEEEIASFFSSPENAQWMTQLSEKSKAAYDEAQLISAKAEAGKKMANVLNPYDQLEALQTAHQLLLSAYESKSVSLATADLNVIGKHGKLKKKQAIALANDRRNQSRRQGLLFECFVHLMFVLFTFFTAYVNCDYENYEPEYAKLVYQRYMDWNTTTYPDLDLYFREVIAPWKRTALNSSWHPREIRLRQIRVDCSASTQCQRYSPTTRMTASPFNPTAAGASKNPEAFNYQLKSSSNPIASLSWYWDTRRLLTDYEDHGGYFLEWPITSENELPDFNGWIDAGTSMVSIEFNAYEPNTDLIVALKIIAQYPSYRYGHVLDELPPGAEECRDKSLPPIIPAVLIQPSSNLERLRSEELTMTILCAFALAAGLLSILRGLGMFKIAVSGDRDIVRAVEVYKPNAGLLRSAMMALRVARSERLFNPSTVSMVFWLVLESIVMTLLIAGLVYHYVVVHPLYNDLESFGSNSGSGDVNGYMEIYGILREINVVNMLFAYASWIAIFTSIRLLLLISSGVLIADTITQSILPGLLVLFVCGYGPMGIALASVGYIMFGYVNPAFQTFELSAYSVVSKYFFLDIVIAPTWRPLFTFIILLYYTVTSAIAYAIVFDAFKRESSKLVKGPFTIWEIIWPFPAIRSWMREGFKNDLWASTSRKSSASADSDKSSNSGFNGENPMKRTGAVLDDDLSPKTTFDESNDDKAPSRNPGPNNVQARKKSSRAGADEPGEGFMEGRPMTTSEFPDEGNDAIVPRGSLASVENPSTIVTDGGADFERRPTL